MSHPEFTLHRSETQKRKDISALHEAKRMEQKQLSEGYHYVWLNNRTQVLRKIR